MKGSFAQVSRFLHPPSPTWRAYPRRELAMAWGPVVGGVDASPAAVGAAVLAELIAKLAAVRCDLVHAVRDAWAPLVAVNPDPEVVEMQLLQQAVARERVHHVLKGAVSHRVLETLKVRLGPAAVVLRQVAEETRPGLLVLGGKHHTALERWLGGSTSLHVVRTSEVPVLITAREPVPPRRVLLAADVLVAGSDGKGWDQRVLAGSVTERLINHLPTSLLVAPVGVAAAALSERRERQLAIH